MVQPLRVEVLGGGIAAATTAHLLAQSGVLVRWEMDLPRRERIVTVPLSTVDLIEHLVGISVSDAVPSRRVTSRCVSWDDRDFSVMPLDTLVLDADALAVAIAQEVPADAAANGGVQGLSADWTVTAGGRRQGPYRMSAGTRKAVAGWIPFVPGFDDSATLVASVPQGWLFACPHPLAGVSIVVVSPGTYDAIAPAEVLAKAADFVWPGVVETVICHTDCFVPAMPSFEPDCVERGRIAVGEAAITFDPLCGDGVGHAVRGALLASSVIIAIRDGGEPSQHLAHYRQRLAHAFLGHVRIAAAHYSTSWNSSIWSDDIAAMSELFTVVATPEKFKYRLHGRRLVVA